MSKKVLITGADGQLGAHLCDKLFDNFNIIKTSNKKTSNGYYLDITKNKHFELVFNQEKPQVIINCASYNSVDNCGTDKVKARSVIVDGISNIIKHSSKDAFIIHISSDYVFNGKKTIYSENDSPDPINYYGKLKLESENILKGSNRKYAIVRPNVVFSSDINNRSNFLGWVLRNLKASNTINVVNDQISNPTPVELLKQVLESIVLLNSEGIFNVGTPDPISRYHFAIKIAKIFGYDTNFIKSISTKNLNQAENRPKNTYLSFERIISELDIDIYSLDYYLEHYKEASIE